MLYELSHYEAMTLQDACVAAQCRAEENAESAERCANDPHLPEAEDGAAAVAAMNRKDWGTSLRPLSLILLPKPGSEK